MVLMAFRMIRIQFQGTAIGVQGCSDVSAAALHQPEVVPGEGYLRSSLGSGSGEADRFLQLSLIEQPGGKIESCSKADPCVQGDRKSLPVRVDGTSGIALGQGKAQV